LDLRSSTYPLSVRAQGYARRPAHGFLEISHHLLRGIVVGSGSYNAQWFERILRRYQHELWIGDAAEIPPRTATSSRNDPPVTRQQKVNDDMIFAEGTANLM
jgi:hypothetical protein